MIRSIYFDRFRGNHWPDPMELKPFFLAPAGHEWSYLGGNDSWGLNVNGRDGTSRLPDADQVRVSLTMIGKRDFGVYLAYRKWDGRIHQQSSLSSKGDLSRLGQLTQSLHETPLSAGLFVPFAHAWSAVQQFMDTDGDLPDSIAWIAARDLPAGAFPDPK